MLLLQYDNWKILRIENGNMYIYIEKIIHFQTDFEERKGSFLEFFFRSIFQMPFQLPKFSAYKLP